jgi:HEAT repeat protein
MVEELIAKLRSDDDYHRRISAAQALGKAGDTAAVEALREALWDRDPDVRLSAGLALIKIGDPRAFDALYEATRTELYGLDCPASRRPLNSYWNVERASWVRLSAFEAIAVAGLCDARAVDALCGALSDDSWQVVDRAVKTLSSFGDARAVEPLCKLLKIGGRAVKGAAKALHNIRDPRAVEPLCQLIEDGDSNMRATAIRALSGFHDPRETEPLCKALTDKSAEVRSLASEVLGLGGMSGARVIKPLCKAFVEEKDRILRSLAQFGRPAVQSLVEALREAEEQVRRDAVADLRKHSKRDAAVGVGGFADQVLLDAVDFI